MHEGDKGDYIGSESCADMMIGGGCYGDADECGGGEEDQRFGVRREIIRKGEKKKKKKEYPPPIRCLARTENAHSSHMPWVMKRYYTSDGRLIIREEKSANSDFLRARRSNGRLTLQLVPMAARDDGNDDDDVGCNVGVEEERENVVVVGDGDVIRVAGGGGDEVVVGGGGGDMVVVGGGGGGGIKCYNYETARSNSCLHVMQVPAV